MVECKDKRIIEKYNILKQEMAITSAFVGKQCNEMKEDMKWMVPMERAKDLRMKKAIEQVKIEEWMFDDDEVESDWDDKFIQMKDEMEVCPNWDSPKLKLKV